MSLDGRKSRMAAVGKMTAQRQELEKETIDLHGKTFKAWMNKHLKKAGIRVMDIQEDLRDGLILIALIEVLIGKKCPFKYHLNPKTQPTRLANCCVAVDFLQQYVNMAVFGKDIEEGNIRIILGMIWRLILHDQMFSQSFQRAVFATQKEGFSDNFVVPEKTEKSFTVQSRETKNQLLEWIKYKTAGYDGVKVEDFTNSFHDGLALCALINKYDPSLLDYNSLDKNDVRGNLEKAFQIAEKHMDIPQLIDVDDMMNPDREKRPDEQCMITYLSQFPRAFLEQLEKKLNERKNLGFTAERAEREELQPREARFSEGRSNSTEEGIAPTSSASNGSTKSIGTDSHDHDHHNHDHDHSHDNDNQKGNQRKQHPGPELPPRVGTYDQDVDYPINQQKSSQSHQSQSHPSSSSSLPPSSSHQHPHDQTKVHSPQTDRAVSQGKPLAEHTGSNVSNEQHQYHSDQNQQLQYPPPPPNHQPPHLASLAQPENVPGLNFADVGYLAGAPVKKSRFSVAEVFEFEDTIHFDNAQTFLVSRALDKTEVDNTVPDHNDLQRMVQERDLQQLKLDTLQLEEEIKRLRQKKLVGVITVGVLEAHNLHGGRNTHPYTLLTVERQREKTRKIKHTTNPKWDSGFQFYCGDVNATIVVRIYDYQRFLPDGLLGFVEIPVKELVDGQTFEKWFPLVTKSGKKASGEILLRIRYQRDF